MRNPRLVDAAAWIALSLALLVPAAVLGKGGGGGGTGGGGAGGGSPGSGGGSKTNPPPPKGEEKVVPFSVGDVVKEVSIDRVGGGTWNPVGASGKVSLLDFGGKDRLGEMRKLHDLLKGREGKLLVLGVLVGMEMDEARDAIKAEKEKIETPLGVDQRKDAVAHFASSGTTAVAIVGTDSKLVYKASSWNAKEVEAQIEKLVPAAKPADKPGDAPPKK